MASSQQPIIYEINTWVWLADLSHRYGSPITLANVPAEALDEIAGWHVEYVWLMGVWQRSPLGRKIAAAHPDLQNDFRRVLPDYTSNDVVGSPYAIYRYAVDPHLGGRDALATFRAQLRERNIRLILDYVPNHVSLDHHWTQDCPDCLIRGSDITLKANPDAYFRAANGRVFAHGRDPYFPAWTDTAQVDAFSSTGRQQALATLHDIASQCDGVRCDMAMLMVNRIFAGLWGNGRDVPETEYWREMIPPIKAEYPDFLFMAEVYWDMEAELQWLGFDFTYDKRLYDRLMHEPIHAVRDHLLASAGYQRQLVRFVENHDESRAGTAFGSLRSAAASALMMALPGAKLLHEGQFEGRKIKVPVQLGRRPPEAPNEFLLDFYRKAMHEFSQRPYREGVYLTLGVHPILGDDDGHIHLLACARVSDDDQRVVVINYSNQTVKGRLLIPFVEFAGSGLWAFWDALGGTQPYVISGEDLLLSGLPVELPAYGVNLFSVRKV